MASLGAVEPLARHHQEPLEQTAADDMDGAEGDAREQVFPSHRADGTDDGEGEHQAGQQPEEIAGTAAPAFGQPHEGGGKSAHLGCGGPEGVHDKAEDRREAAFAGCGEQKAEHGEGEVALLIRDMAEQATVDLPVAGGRRGFAHGARAFTRPQRLRPGARRSSDWWRRRTRRWCRSQTGGP